MKGRKRHLLVCTQGWLLQLLVHPANIQEREGAQMLLQSVQFPAERMQKMWADAGYWGSKFSAWVEQKHGWQVEVVSRNTLVNRRDGRPGFLPLPRRWVVERSFAWLGKWRRLSRDYEQNPRSSEAWIRLAFIGIMLGRLTRSF